MDWQQYYSSNISLPDRAASNCPLEILLFIQAEIPASADPGPEPDFEFFRCCWFVPLFVFKDSALACVCSSAIGKNFGAPKTPIFLLGALDPLLAAPTLPVLWRRDCCCWCWCFEFGIDFFWISIFLPAFAGGGAIKKLFHFNSASWRVGY